MGNESACEDAQEIELRSSVSADYKNMSKYSHTPSACIYCIDVDSALWLSALCFCSCCSFLLCLVFSLLFCCHVCTSLSDAHSSPHSDSHSTPIFSPAPGKTHLPSPSLKHTFGLTSHLLNLLWGFTSCFPMYQVFTLIQSLLFSSDSQSITSCNSST